jgi:hypothetical protein
MAFSSQLQRMAGRIFQMTRKFGTGKRLWELSGGKNDPASTPRAQAAFTHQHQIGRPEEAGLVAPLSREVAERDREVSLAHARWSEKYHVLGALDEGEAGQLHDLLARRAAGEIEVVLVKGLDRDSLARYRSQQWDG